jgi:hypothetical protein
MLFRTNTGELIEIKRYNYPNDKLYYKKIMEVKQHFSKSFLSSTKSEKTLDNKNN